MGPTGPGPVSEATVTRELLRLWRASPGGSSTGSRWGRTWPGRRAATGLLWAGAARAAGGGTPGRGTGRPRGFPALASSPPLSLVRDGGLKREKVKDTFKEEQQKLYSKMIVGNHEDRSRS